MTMSRTTVPTAPTDAQETSRSHTPNPPSQSTRPTPEPSAPAADEDDDDEIYDDDDIYDEDDAAEDMDWDASATDLTKSYNRQRQLHGGAQANTGGSGGGGVLLPRSNQQKPTANTSASVDDQLTALSRHAAKIRLDGGTRSDDRDKDKDKADRATSEQVLDQRTRMVLLQMINRGIVSEVHGAISTGKEANVYGAVVEGPDGQETHRAIKVYKTAILVFKDRERYIAGEHRFRGGYDKGNNRKMVKLWAEKEYRNLRRIHAAGIPCPEPFYLKLHVLTMSFLGDKRGWAYPRLRDAALERTDAADVDRQWHDLYAQLLGIMRRLYQVCRLVHADLSEYNLLYHAGRLFLIDVSQSVEPDHPRALEFLRMDIKNVGDFFRRKGVDTLADRAVFDFVTVAEGTTTDPDELPAAVQRLYDARPAVDDDDADAASAERAVADQVFRHQYIPRTLEEVYDMEKDARKIGMGEGADLVYRGLLADSVVRGRQDTAGAGAAGEDEEEGEDDTEDSSDGSDNGAPLGGAEGEGEDGEDESRFEKGRPRGRKFEPRDEKKAHKQAVKEANRDKRKEKMPKYVKKKLVNTSAKKGK